MPSVDSIAFDTMRGLPQAPLIPSQASAAIAAGLAVGLIPAQSPEDVPVDITTQIDVTNEAGCIALAKSCRALVGKIVTVTVFTAVTVTRQFVQEVDCQWKAVTGTGLNFLFTARWKLIATYAESDAEDNRSLAEVYTAKVFGNWTRQYKLRCFGAAEGLGSYAGEADLVQKIGVVNELPADPLDIIGQWVELRARTALGQPAIPVWWGFVQARSLERVQSGSEASFRCVGLIDALRTVFLNRWYEYGASSVVIDPGSILPFNDVPKGNRSNSASNTIGSSSTRYVHDRAYDRSLGGAHVWTAKQVLQTVLSAIEDQYPDGPNWTLTGQTSALNYDFSADISGLSCYDILQMLITPARAMTFNVRPVMTGAGNAMRSTATIEIEVSTVLPVTVNIPAQGIPSTTAITFPAAYRQMDLDLSRPAVVDWDIKEDSSDVYDRIYVEGPRPLHTTTVGFNLAGASTSSAAGQAQLEKDWTSSDETLWLAANEARRNQQDLVHVNRRFRFKAAWQANAYTQSSPAAPLGCSRAVDANGNETGEYVASGSTEWPNGSLIKVTRSLPIPTIPIAAGGNWDLSTSLSAITLDHTQPNERLQAYQVSGFNVWSILHFDYELSVTNDRGSVMIGRNAADGLAIKTLLSAGTDIVFTLGYEWPKTWRVSWRRSPPALTGLQTLTPRDCERTLWIKVDGEGYQRREIDRGTVISLNGTSPNRVVGNFQVSRPGNIYQTLELAKIRYTKPKIHAKWTVDGSLDLNWDNRPGVLVKRALVPYANRDSKYMDINAVLTRRSWCFVTSAPSTKYHIAPVLTDMNDVTAMTEGANGPAGFGNGNGGGKHITGQQ